MMWPFFTAVALALIGLWAQQRKDAAAVLAAGKARDAILNRIEVNVDGNLSKAMEKIDRLERLLEKTVDK
jgi:hypothetical protein